MNTTHGGLEGLPSLFITLIEEEPILAITTTVSKEVNPTLIPCLMQSRQTKAVYLITADNGDSYKGVLLKVGDMSNRTVGECRSNLARENLTPYSGEVTIKNV